MSQQRSVERWARTDRSGSEAVVQAESLTATDSAFLPCRCERSRPDEQANMQRLWCNDDLIGQYQPGGEVGSFREHRVPGRFGGVCFLRIQCGLLLHLKNF